MIRDLKPVWRRRSNTEISATPGNLVALLRLALMSVVPRSGCRKRSSGTAQNRPTRMQESGLRFRQT